MKLTTEHLKKLILEELNEMDHVVDGYTYPLENASSNKMSIQDKIEVEKVFQIINNLQKKFNVKTNRDLAELLNKAMVAIREILDLNQQLDKL